MKMKIPRRGAIITFAITLLVFSLLFRYWDEVKEFIVLLFR